MRRPILIAIALLLLWRAAQDKSAAAAAGRWYKGNIHAHTLNSDGDSSPLDVATWYREHDYQFLTLSDHNYLTDAGALNPVIGRSEKFLLVQGEEVTSAFEKKPVHINAINLRELVPAQQGSSVVDVLRRNLSAIHAKGAMPSVNHPNFGWGVTAEDLLQADGLTHFEVYNSNPGTNNHGGSGSPSVEEMWDVLLTAGRRVHAVAVDDAHSFKKWGRKESNPGGAWVMARAEALEADKITEALRSGDFYATTGVLLDTIDRSAAGLSLSIRAQGNFRFVTYFIGPGGKVLARDTTMTPSYRFRGSESYVRARVESSEGDRAWTQASFRTARP